MIDSKSIKNSIILSICLLMLWNVCRCDNFSRISLLTAWLVVSNITYSNTCTYDVHRDVLRQIDHEFLVITFNFNWSNSKIHNFFLKNRMFLIDLNFFNNISSYNFLFSCKTFRISVHVWSSWLAVLTRSNKDNFKFEFFFVKTSFVSFNCWTIRESIFSVDKSV
jgi:hypothetical protein